MLRSACSARRIMPWPVRVSAHAQFCHPEWLRTPGAPAVNLESIGVSCFTRIGNGLRQLAAPSSARATSTACGTVRAGHSGTWRRCGCRSLWGARVTRAAQQCVSVHGRESHFVFVACTNEFLRATYRSLAPLSTVSRVCNNAYCIGRMANCGAKTGADPSVGASCTKGRQQCSAPHL